MKILVVDVGGTHVKCAASDHPRPRRFRSGPAMTAGEMVKQVLKVSRAWRYQAVSIGYPGVVKRGQPVREPHNLAAGWVGFDFKAAFGRPVRIVNDAAMQALGGYQGGHMLFLGLGTGLGSALIVDGVIAALELGHLPWSRKHDYEHYVGDRGRKRLGQKKWNARVRQAVKNFRLALLPDDIVIGGGNAHRLKKLPPHTRRGTDSAAFHGGLHLWDDHGRVERASPPRAKSFVRTSRSRRAVLRPAD